MTTAPILVAGRAFTPWFDPSELDANAAECFERRGSELVPLGPGFFSVQGKLAFVLPRPWRTRTEPGPDEPLLTLRTLSRYAEHSTQRAVTDQALSLSSGSLDHSGNALLAVQNALMIWEDAKAHGPLWRSEFRKGPRELGRTQWSQTLTRSPTLPLRHTTIYPSPIRARHRLDAHSPLTLVHAQAVAEVRERLGAGPGPNHPIGRTKARQILDGYAQKVFSDRMRRVFPLLRRHFSPHRGFRRQATSHTAESLFARRFEYVWEAMLTVALGPALKPQTIRGQYRRPDPSQLNSLPGARLHPDLVVDLPDHRGDPYRVVIDAKHYRPEHPPGTESIAKQMVYRHLLSQEFRSDGPPAERIGNAFLLPEVLSGSTLARVLYTHDLHGEQHRGADSFGRIVVLGVNLVETQRAYLSRRPSTELRHIVGRLVSENMNRSIRSE